MDDTRPRRVADALAVFLFVAACFALAALA